MKILLKSGIALALGLLLYSSRAQAQAQVWVNAPYWGPAVAPHVQYYYIPEIDGYYDLYAQSYLFYDPGFGAWVSSPMLPRAYASYDPRFFHPVVIEYVGRQPWGYLRDHRAYCGRWGVAPGRYYGANWPGRGYNAAPYGAYGPAYYGNRPANQGGYVRNDYHDTRSNQHSYGGRNDYRNQNGRDNSPDNRGSDRNEQSTYNNPRGPQSPGSPQHQGGQQGPNGASNGRGRGRVM